MTDKLTNHMEYLGALTDAVYHHKAITEPIRGLSDEREIQEALAKRRHHQKWRDYQLRRVYEYEVWLALTASLNEDNGHE